MASPQRAAAHEADQYMYAFCSGTAQEIKDWEAGRTEFRALYKKAFKNNYQTQRNLAYVLWNGSTVVVSHRKQSCAWRVAIIWLMSSQVDDSDRGNMKTYCGMLFADERPEALEMGKIIGRRVKAGGRIDEHIEPPPPPGLDSIAEPL